MVQASRMRAWVSAEDRPCGREAFGTNDFLCGGDQYAADEETHCRACHGLQRRDFECLGDLAQDILNGVIVLKQYRLLGAAILLNSMQP